MSSQVRIPTLDGWRGVAILMVLCDHALFAWTGHYPQAWMRTGVHGVTLFFVLSGYLITSNLLSEHLDLRRFYVKRFFRIMPVAWTFLAVLALLKFTTWAEIRGCLFFYRNYLGDVGSAGHFWSLSIEEQFYFVWPWVLIIMGVRLSRWLAIAGALSVALFRLLLWQKYSSGFFYQHTEVRADALLVGCILALVLEDPESRISLAKCSRMLAIPAASAFLVGVAFYHVLQPLWESAAIALLLAYTSLHPSSVASRALERRAIVFLGKLSYSIYVWQELFTLLRGRSILLGYLVLLPPVALLSYSMIEVPIRRFGTRIARWPREHAPTSMLAPSTPQEISHPLDAL